MIKVKVNISKELSPFLLSPLEMETVYKNIHSKLQSDLIAMKDVDILQAGTKLLLTYS